jgi:hypothetical protein
LPSGTNPLGHQAKIKRLHTLVLKYRFLKP